MAGAERDQTGTMVAKYWKNGTPTLLTNTVNSDAFANAIFVSGNDVYVTGIDGAQGKYWKNGVATLLEAGAMSNPEGKDILVLNNDVYVAGNKMTSNTVETAVVWKNGTGTTLTGTTYSSAVNAIATNGKDIFVVGDEFIDANNAVTKYWKNSVGVTIAQGGAAYDIAVDGNDVYVAGSVWNETKKTAMAVYWKNGTQKLLTDGTNYAKAVSIAVHNGDVFVLANELVSSKWTMEYWKNDVLVPVGRGTGSDIAIVGNDVYVVGGFANAAGIPVARYWKNGVAVNLSNGTYDAVAYGICLR